MRWWVERGRDWTLVVATCVGDPIEIEVDNQSRAFFSLQNGANLVIPCKKHVLLDTQNTKNHNQSINLTRVVLHPRRNFLRRLAVATFSWRESRAIFASLAAVSASAAHAIARLASSMDHQYLICASAHLCSTLGPQARTSVRILRVVNN